MGQTVSPKTFVFNLNQTPGNYQKEHNLNIVNHDESLKFNKKFRDISRYIYTFFAVFQNSCVFITLFANP